MMRQGTVLGKKSGGTFRHNNITAGLLYGLAALIILLLQNAPSFFPTVFHARPLPIVIFVVCVAVLEGGKAGAVIGAISGLLWGLYAFRVFGFDALILMLMGLTAGLLVEWYLRANIMTALLLCASAVVIQALVDWLCTYVVCGHPAALSILLWAYMPNGMYTIVLSPLMYWLVLQMARLLRRK